MSTERSKLTPWIVSVLIVLCSWASALLFMNTPEPWLLLMAGSLAFFSFQHRKDPERRAHHLVRFCCNPLLVITLLTFFSRTAAYVLGEPDYSECYSDRFDPELRLSVRSSDCEFPLVDFFDQGPGNATTMAWIRAFGPAPGAYTGHIPRAKEILRLADKFEEVDARLAEKLRHFHEPQGDEWFLSSRELPYGAAMRIAHLSDRRHIFKVLRQGELLLMAVELEGRIVASFAFRKSDWTPIAEFEHECRAIFHSRIFDDETNKNLKGVSVRLLQGSEVVFESKTSDHDQLASNVHASVPGGSYELEVASPAYKKEFDHPIELSCGSSLQSTTSLLKR